MPRIWKHSAGTGGIAPRGPGPTNAPRTQIEAPDVFDFPEDDSDSDAPEDEQDSSSESKSDAESVPTSREHTQPASQKRTDLARTNHVPDPNANPTRLVKRVDGFQCPVDGCMAIRASAYSLRRHMTGSHGPLQVMLTCNACGAQFKNGQNLRRHASTQHSPAAFKCPYCPRTFKRKDACERHWATVHIT